MKKLHVEVSDEEFVTLEQLAQARTLDVWYFHVAVDRVMDVFASSSKKAHKSAKKTVRKAKIR